MFNLWVQQGGKAVASHNVVISLLVLGMSKTYQGEQYSKGE